VAQIPDPLSIEAVPKLRGVFHLSRADRFFNQLAIAGTSKTGMRPKTAAKADHNLQRQHLSLCRCYPFGPVAEVKHGMPF
jgi:hypothetical protein